MLLHKGFRIKWLWLLHIDAFCLQPVTYGVWASYASMRAAQGIIMAEGYCVKCKAKKEIVDAVEEVMKNGRKAIKGKCPTCGTVMFKILGKAGSTPPPAAPAGEPSVPPAPAPAPSTTSSG